MAEFHKIAAADELAAGEVRQYLVEDRPVALCNVDGELHAFEMDEDNHALLERNLALNPSPVTVTANHVAVSSETGASMPSFRTTWPPWASGPTPSSGGMRSGRPWTSSAPTTARHFCCVT